MTSKWINCSKKVYKQEKKTYLKFSSKLEQKKMLNEKFSNFFPTFSWGASPPTGVPTSCPGCFGIETQANWISGSTGYQVVLVNAYESGQISEFSTKNSSALVLTKISQMSFFIILTFSDLFYPFCRKNVMFEIFLVQNFSTLEAYNFFL